MPESTMRSILFRVFVLTLKYLLMTAASLAGAVGICLLFGRGFYMLFPAYRFNCSEAQMTERGSAFILVALFLAVLSFLVINSSLRAIARGRVGPASVTAIFGGGAVLSVVITLLWFFVFYVLNGQYWGCGDTNGLPFLLSQFPLYFMFCASILWLRAGRSAAMLKSQETSSSRRKPSP